MPPKPFTLSLQQISLKCTSFWKSVLRFGLPFVVLYRGIDYLIFRITTGEVGLRYPWRAMVTINVLLMLLVSAIWWGLMRQVAAWNKDKRP